MKRRVRGLLRKNRVKPLCALTLAWLPMLIVTVVTTLFMSSFWTGIGSLVSQIRELILENGLQMAVLSLLYGASLDYSQLIASIPACAIFIGTYLFIGMPISVSLSGFMLSFLRGKETKVTDVYSCFSGKYPRILAGMLYKQLWVLIWGAAVVAIPVLFEIVANFFVETYVVQLSFKMYFFIGVVAFSVVLFLILLFLLINRLLAYHLTQICIAAQPRLSPVRAVRLSRKLMRGQKGSLIGLYLSFLSFYLPTIICGAVLPLAGNIAEWFSLAEEVLRLLQTGLICIIGLNLLVTLYVAPYLSLSVRAFYIERKREALLDEELTPADFASERIKV